MGKVFRPSNKEAILLSKIESSKERKRKQAIISMNDNIDALSNAVSMKLVEEKLVETLSKNSLEVQIHRTLKTMNKADDFDIDYKIAPYRNLVASPHIISIYLTSFILEDLINHKDTVDIFGSDEEIYYCINKQCKKYCPIN